MKNYVLSISYGDYKDSLGGTDKVILTHQKMFEQIHVNHMHIFPYKLLSKSREIKKWNVIYNGTIRKVYSTRQLNKLFNEWKKENFLCSAIFIHHLKSINIDELIEVLSNFDCLIYFYIHDYYNICKSINLMNSNNELCTHRYYDEELCSNCKYFSNAKVMSQVIQDFHNRFNQRVKYICPSDSCAKIYSNAYPFLKENIKVVYHQKLLNNSLEQRIVSKPIKIAYIGSSKEIKGWNVFLELFEKYKNDKNYDFYLFNNDDIDIAGIRHIVCDFRDANSKTEIMLKKYHIDIAFLWSIWPETYAYTFYEAFITGSYIVSCSNSGNIAAQVKIRRNGKIFNSKTELFEWFEKADDVFNEINTFISEPHTLPHHLEENDEIISTFINDKNCLYKPKFIIMDLCSVILIKIYELKLSIKKWRNKR